MMVETHTSPHPRPARAAAVDHAKGWGHASDMASRLRSRPIRYHGHSMSDPGITYRSSDDVAGVRKARDPVATVKTSHSARRA